MPEICENKLNKMHFIGIGGIGMSALGGFYLARGVSVSGSELRPNNLTRGLEGKGAVIFSGHKPDNLEDDVDVVVTTNCIREDNPEIIKAKDKGMTIIRRSDLLGHVLGKSGSSVGITGTHGKTTTSALISSIMEHCGMDPTVLLGGEVDIFKGNMKYGREDLVVAEVDESDGLFENMSVKYAVLTNIEREHMEHYGDMDTLVKAYKGFISRIPEGGVLVYNGEDPVLDKLSACTNAKKISFGRAEKGNYTYSSRDAYFSKSIRFALMISGEEKVTISSSLIGEHNVMNILAAVGICGHLGLDLRAVSEAVTVFKNAGRRFDLVGRTGGIEIYEDYAHHPTELKAVIRAAKDYSPGGRVIAVFQPHRHSRTHDLADDFLDCFNDASVLVLTDVYSADEDEFEGKGIMDIYRNIDKDRFTAVDLVDKDSIPAYISGIARDGDIVLILGAGDIRDIAGRTLKEVKRAVS